MACLVVDEYGFSTQTCLPSLNNFNANSKCLCLGDAITIISALDLINLSASVTTSTAGNLDFVRFTWSSVSHLQKNIELLDVSKNF